MRKLTLPLLASLALTAGCASPPHMDEPGVVSVIGGISAKTSEYKPDALKKCPSGSKDVDFLYSGAIGIGLANAMYYRCK